MATLTYHEQRARWEYRGTPAERWPAKNAKFRWNPALECWWTDDREKALALRDYADSRTAATLSAIVQEREELVEQSRAQETSFDPPARRGLPSTATRRSGSRFSPGIRTSFSGMIWGSGKPRRCWGS